MNSTYERSAAGVLALLLLTSTLTVLGAEPHGIPLRNPSFEEGVDSLGIPLGWTRYGDGSSNKTLEVTTTDNRKALLIADSDRTSETGVSQTFALSGNDTYQVTVKVRAVKEASTSGAYLQLRFLPSNTYVQTDLKAKSEDEFSEVSVIGTAPPDTNRACIYLYTHRGPTPQVLVTDVRVTGGHPAPPPPPPEPIPPQYEALKDLHIDIPLVETGKPDAAIVIPASGAYRMAAEKIQRAVEKSTAVSLPILADDSPQAVVPILQNLIVLGNRSSNKTINTLYDHYYCLVDLKYPGPEGYAIRTIHNPYGNGKSVVLVGGSDPIGVDSGADVLATILWKATVKGGRLSIGWTMETQLGKGVTPPTDIKQFETWEASRGYGSIGYFGWCSISKHMAMYYMTGNEANAREVVRLAFPDEQAIRDIEEIDGERIENKNDPLAGFYHYNAHMAILFWDLIEESPVFTDAERLKITNAFARQLNHRKGEGIYRLTRPPRSVGSRHGQWAAISLYCLGRYFNKDYPHPIWAQCVRGGKLAFAPLHESAWVAGESDNLFWYCTGIAPVLTYMTLTGDRKPLENGVLAGLLRGQEALISGRDKDWALNSASVGMLNKASYLTGDGRWITYRQRTGVDTSVFRLGQSFWPDESIEPQLPKDLAGKWTIDRLPEPAWASRGSDIPLDQSFYFGSYRSAPDAAGDFILLDGFNGASRNPYHTFDILQLRIDGQTILDGYHNQVLTSADGMVEPTVAMDAALIHADVTGQTAIAVGEVPDAAFCTWRRALAQRTGRYALVMDDLTFRTTSQNMSAETTWQVPGGRWDVHKQAVLSKAGEVYSCDAQRAEAGNPVTLQWTGVVDENEHRFAFYLLLPTPSGKSGESACLRLAENAAVLRLPAPALAFTGKLDQNAAALAIIAEDHLYGHALTNAETLVSSDAPVDIDWDFNTAAVHLVASRPTSLRMNVADPAAVRMDSNPVAVPQPNASLNISLPEGRHVITGASPAADTIAVLTASLQQSLATAESTRNSQLEVLKAANELPTRTSSKAFSYQLNGKVADLVAIDSAADVRLAAATGNTVHLLNAAGELVRTLQADDRIRVLHWWAHPRLLLAGCLDEKVIAFDLNGERRWSFTSEMDRAVYEAAKTYWFKSAPGHEGIHGLYSGLFDDGNERCFVGSACTLEVLDEDGNLVKRTPVFWGPGRKFLLLDRPDGSRNLLISRWPNGNDFLSVVNSRTMTVTDRGYYSVPKGHSFVGGWTAQNRTGLFCEDMDGDGQPEVATAINGTWNRASVYSRDGTPLYNAQFGPGPSKAPRSRMRDMLVADLDADGKKEILVALSDGLVVCLNHRCEKLWSVRLPDLPRSLQCVESGNGPPEIVIGCDDGAIVAFESPTNPVQIGQVRGQPTQRLTMSTDSGPIVVFATGQGEVAGFRIER